jgi:ribosome biogenesis GTPase
MYALDFGGYIIDTPGIKGFGLVDINEFELGDYFPEIRALKSQCKFNNCLHINEPHCAVKKALEKEEIHVPRYESYLTLMENDESPYRISKYH